MEILPQDSIINIINQNKSKITIITKNSNRDNVTIQKLMKKKLILFYRNTKQCSNLYYDSIIIQVASHGIEVFKEEHSYEKGSFHKETYENFVMRKLLYLLQTYPDFEILFDENVKSWEKLNWHASLIRKIFDYFFN